MAPGLSMRSSLRAALLFPVLFVIPQLASADRDARQTYSDYDFYTLVARQPSSPATSPNIISPGTLPGESIPATNPLPAGAAAGNPPRAPPPPPVVDDHRTFVAEAVALPLATWVMVLSAIALAALLLWGIKPLHCLLFGHHRSRMSVRFDDHEQRWVSNCKYCKTALIRDAAGAWRRGSSRKSKRIAKQPPSKEAPVFVFSPERKAQHEPIERVSPIGEQEEPAIPLEVRARSVVSRLLDDVRGGTVPTPGARGALFSLVDELRARLGPDECTLCAEKISLRMQQLECALQRGDKDEAKLARRDLKALAGTWMTSEAGKEASAATELAL